MKPYCHLSHVGDHGDALKHTLLLLVQQKMQSVCENLRYIDTHAGRGWYELSVAPRNHMQELTYGVGKLWQDYLSHESDSDEQAKVIMKLMRCLERYNNRDESLDFYPGSPLLIAINSRFGDSLKLNDAQQKEADILREAICSDLHYERVCDDITIECCNGFEWLGEQPAAYGGNLILIDPPYESKAEYQQVLDTLVNLHASNRNYTALVWYPVYKEDYSHLIVSGAVDLIQEGKLPEALQAELIVRPSGSASRLTGSGILMFNPPKGMQPLAENHLKYLYQILCTEDEGNWYCGPIV